MARSSVPSAIALLVALAAPLAARADSGRPDPYALPVPPGGSREQILLGDRIFHGEAANGTCFSCHGADARGTANGNDLTLGFLIWGDVSRPSIKRTLLTNMKLAPGRDGDLTPDDVDAVVAYVWALGHQKN